MVFERTTVKLMGWPIILLLQIGDHAQVNYHTCKYLNSSIGACFQRYGL